MSSARRTSIALFAATLAACGGPQQGNLSYGESARRDYERAQAAFEDDDCLTATPLFQNVRREYPYSRYAALSELRLADCELSQQHYTEAIRAYRSFVRQRPTHPEVDTANYSIARAYFQQIPQDFFLSPPAEERDQAATRSALRVVRRFLLDYPESEHIEDARRLERQVLDLLARHELYVASYYLNRDQPEATIARVQTLLAEYDDSRVVPEALLLMGRTYLHVRDPRNARLAFGEIVDRFPTSGYAVQARNYLSVMGDIAEQLEDTPAPRRGRGTTPGGVMPGTDIDDVTGEGSDDLTGDDGASDSLEDASEAGIGVREDGVTAGDLSPGETPADVVDGVDPDEEDPDQLPPDTFAPDDEDEER